MDPIDPIFRIPTIGKILKIHFLENQLWKYSFIITICRFNSVSRNFPGAIGLTYAMIGNSSIYLHYQVSQYKRLMWAWILLSVLLNNWLGRIHLKSRVKQQQIIIMEPVWNIMLFLLTSCFAKLHVPTNNWIQKNDQDWFLWKNYWIANQK